MARKNPILAAYDNAYNEAVRDLRKIVLDHLEQMYMDPSVVRGTPMADAILRVTREVSELLKQR